MLRTSTKKDNDPHNLCRGATLVPSVVGPDQGWHFVRRIVVGNLFCAVYEVDDNWRPRDDKIVGEVFFTKLQRGERAGINWEKMPLGKMPDAEISEQLGVDETTVRKARQKRKIESHRKSMAIDWENQPLGEMSDSALAKRLGVSANAVWKARTSRGITKFEE